MVPIPLEFDEYLEAFRANSKNPELDYWADVVFLMQSHPSPLVEQRFRGGIPVWLLWILWRALKTSGKHPETAASSDSCFGFRLLPTPAHLESLTPIVEAAEPACTVLFGHPMPDAILRTHVPIALAHSMNVLTLSEKIRALWRALIKTRGIMATLSNSAVLDSIPANGFKARLAEFLYTYELEFQHQRESGRSLRSLFVSYELITDTKALVVKARESGARVFHVMHGQRLPTYQLTRATDLILFSKIDEPWFRARVPKDVRIWTIGHPRLEKIRREVPAPTPSINRILPRIAYFSQPSEGDYSQELRLRDWAILAGLENRAEVRFRLHPRESREAALDDLHSLGLEFVKLSEAGLQEDLAWCDAVASSWSTVSMEAAACGRGVFWTCANPERYPASQELREHGIGVLIQNTNDWSSYLASWQAGGWPEPVSIPESRLHELGMIGQMEKSWLERLEISDSTTSN